jgi:predicted nucleotide-binding protein (sugar kinase/HSP70/actin superfamily)
VKVAHGHVRHLIKSGVTTLFMPSFIDMNAADDGEFERGYACPLTQTIPYAAQVAHQKVRLITPVICLSRGKQYLVQELLRVLKPYGIRKKDMFPALMVAERAQQEFFTAVKEKGSEILSSLKEKTVVIVGRPYNAFDSGMNLTIPRKLSDLGVASLPMDFLPIEGFRIADRWPNMYWRSGQRILKAARYIKENPHLYPIFIGNFSCGPDSFILKYFEKEMEEKPFLHIEIDEHSADAGAVTRCEAFLDSIGKQKRPFLTGLQKNVGSQGASPPDSHPGHGRKIGPFTRSSSPGIAAHRLKRTVFIPRMSDHAFALAAAFERCGLSAEVLPESDKESVDIGRRYVSGKECYPCTVTTGDMLKKVFSPDFRPEESVFFMPSGSGPCRFGQYNVFHRMILDELGCRDVPIFSPNQDVSFYQELGVVSKDYSLFAWRGIVAIELLCKCLHETRPYEKETGAADHLFEKYLRKLCLSLRGADGKIETTLNNMRRDFEGLPKLKEKRPVIGVVGEIFVRSHRFSNENLIRKIEAHGGEAWLAPVEEWIYYVNLMATRKALIKKDSSAIIVLLLKTFFQKRTAHHYAKYYQGFLRTLKEPGTKEILNRASPYIDASFEGEAVLSIGKSIDLIGRGVSGIINAMPFGCMPGTVVTTIMRGVSRDYGIPCITMPFDGSESSTTEIQLEAFMNQAKQYKVLPARSR